MAEQFGEKTHEATPHRRQKAREEGHVAKSQDLTSAIILIGALLILLWQGQSLVNFLGHLTHSQLAEKTTFDNSSSIVIHQLRSLVLQLAVVLLPILGLLFVLAVIVQVGQVGILFVPKRLSPALNHINPLRGIQRLLSLPTFVRFALGLSKVFTVSAVGAVSLWLDRTAILSLGGLGVHELLLAIFSLIFWTVLKIGFALLILAIADYAFQYWKHEQDLRMTNHEMREELRSLQGDPQVTARRFAVQRQLVLNRVMSLVPQANVVVTSATELSVAIQYEPASMTTPVVVAKGAGMVAQRIRTLALAANVTIVERKELAQTLHKQVDPGSPISSEHYPEVAEILQYVYRLKNETLSGQPHAA